MHVPAAMMSSPTSAAAASVECATASSLTEPSCPHASAPAMPTTPTAAGHHEHAEPHASSAAAAHAGQLAREQQQMIEQLMSTGLVQPADLLEFGFSADELRAAGLQLHAPSPPPSQAAAQRRTATPMEAMTHPPRRGRPQKRAWEQESVDADTATARVTPPPASTTAPREPATVAKALHATHSTTALSGPAQQQPSSWRSEESRAADLHAAQLAESTRQRVRRSGVTHPCARHLCYDDAQDEEELRTAATATATARAGHGSARCGNSALAFSGLDVAVVKEIAQRLQAECGHDVDIENRRMREYYESREDGNTPYM